MSKCLPIEEHIAEAIRETLAESQRLASISTELAAEARGMVKGAARIYGIRNVIFHADTMEVEEAPSPAETVADGDNP